MTADIVSHHSGLVRSRLRTANFGSRYLGLTLADDSVRKISGRIAPKGIVDVWSNAVRDGKILRAEGQFETCGKGLWIAGNGGSAVACAAVQELLIDRTIESALYVRTEEYLQSERPEGERQYRNRTGADVLILSGYGAERRNESGWAEATLDNLVAGRFDAGLPTIVTSILKTPTTFCGFVGSEVFYGAAIMEASREED